MSQKDEGKGRSKLLVRGTRPQFPSIHCCDNFEKEVLRRGSLETSVPERGLYFNLLAHNQTLTDLLQQDDDGPSSRLGSAVDTHFQSGHCRPRPSLRRYDPTFIFKEEEKQSVGAFHQVSPAAWQDPFSNMLKVHSLIWTFPSSNSSELPSLIHFHLHARDNKIYALEEQEGKTFLSSSEMLSSTHSSNALNLGVFINPCDPSLYAFGKNCDRFDLLGHQLDKLRNSGMR